MTEFSEVIAEIDNLKVEMFARFRHLLQSIAALEARLCKLESVLGIEYKPWIPLERETETSRARERLKNMDVWG